MGRQGLVQLTKEGSIEHDRQPIYGDSIQYWEQPKKGEPRSGYELVDGTSEEVMDSLSLKRL